MLGGQVGQGGDAHLDETCRQWGAQAAMTADRQEGVRVHVLAAFLAIASVPQLLQVYS